LIDCQGVIVYVVAVCVSLAHMPGCPIQDDTRKIRPRPLEQVLDAPDCVFA